MAATGDDTGKPIWLDGDLVEAGRAAVPVLTHSLHYGSGVFEGIRSYGGRIFEVERHMARLIDSARLLGYELRHSASALCEAAEHLLRACAIGDAYLRPIAWRGSEDLDIGGRNATAHVAIAAWEWPAYYDGPDRDPSVSLTRAKWVRPSPEMLPLQSKAAGLYVAATLNRQHARDNGFSDCLVLDADGFVAEATVANLFVVAGGRLLTPPTTRCLEGITRRCVLEIARSLGLEAESEADIRMTDIARADEVFLSGTAVEVIPVTRIEDRPYPVGPVTRSIRSAYRERVRSR